MKTQKSLLIAMFMLACISGGIAQRYTIIVVPERMTFKELVVKYRVVSFEYNVQNVQMMYDLVQAQADRRSGPLSTSKGNLFLFHKKNDDGTTFIKWHFIFWSPRLNTWQVAIDDDIDHVIRLGAGVQVFSKS